MMPLWSVHDASPPPEPEPEPVHRCVAAICSSAPSPTASQDANGLRESDRSGLLCGGKVSIYGYLLDKSSLHQCISASQHGLLFSRRSAVQRQPSETGADTPPSLFFPLARRLLWHVPRIRPRGTGQTLSLRAGGWEWWHCMVETRDEGGTLVFCVQCATQRPDHDDAGDSSRLGVSRV